MPRWIVKSARFLFFVSAIAFIVAPAHAAPKARHGADCLVVGNMVFIAGVLQKHGWAQAKALEIYPDMYRTMYQERGDEAHELARLAIAAAYGNRAKHPKEEPIAFAVAVEYACRQFRGDLDGILGTGA